MMMTEKTKITVQVMVNASMKKVWDSWNNPKHIVNWCFASPDWHCPKAENDLQAGGNFVTRMEAKDGSFGFDFGGVYQEVENQKFISYIMDDGREVSIEFSKKPEGIFIKETFEAEATNPVEMQRDGWQAIMNNYKTYTESL